MSAQNLYDIKVRIGGMSRAMSVNEVTAKTAHEIARDMCAAWGRHFPQALEDGEQWTAGLEETGAYEFDNSEVQILVRRTA